MNIKSLKDKILQLAVTGKLVEQNEKDEPASVLLERIKEEKENLIKEKKIKKEKPLPEITDEEKLVDLPKGWELIRFGDIAKYKKGPFGSSITKSMFIPKSDTAIKVYEQKNAIQKRYDIGEYYISKEKYEELKSFEVYPNDIIVSCAGTIGETYIMPDNIEKGIINQALMKISLSNYIEKEFFLMYFKYILTSQITNESKGSAIKNIPPLNHLKNIVFTLPSLEEQKRIVAKVDELFDLIDELDINKQALLQNIANSRNKVLQLAIQGNLVEQNEKDEPVSILLERIKEEKEQLIKDKKKKKEKLLPEIADEEKTFELPNGWEFTKMGIMAEKIHYGYTASAEDGDTGVRFLRITDIQNNKVNWDTVPFCSIEESKLNSCMLTNNDILIARTGGTIGKSFIVKNVDCTAVFASYLIRLKPLKNVSADYLKLFLESPLYWVQLQEKSQGTGQANVNAVSLSNLIMPLPPLEEQKRIVEKVDVIMEYLDKLQQEIESKEIILSEILQ